MAARDKHTRRTNPLILEETVIHFPPRRTTDHHMTLQQRRYDALRMRLLDLSAPYAHSAWVYVMGELHLVQSEVDEWHRHRKPRGNRDNCKV